MAKQGFALLLVLLATKKLIHTNHDRVLGLIIRMLLGGNFENGRKRSSVGLNRRADELSNLQKR